MRRFLIGSFLLFCVSSVDGRVLSYAPLSDKVSTPAVQDRLSRSLVIIEANGIAWSVPILAPVPAYVPTGELVVYDAYAEAEPRVVLPAAQSGAASFGTGAARAGADGKLRIVVQTDARLPGDAVLPPDQPRPWRFLFSGDGGASWSALALPAGHSLLANTFVEDVGGPVVRNRGSQIRLGNDANPFVLALQNPESWGVWKVTDAGTAQEVAEFAPYNHGEGLSGANREGDRFLVLGRRTTSPPGAANSLFVLDLDGTLHDTGYSRFPSSGPVEGWITPQDEIYVEERLGDGNGKLFLIRAASVTQVAESNAAATAQTRNFFAVPTFDFAGAWVLQRGTGRPTVLSRHTPALGLVQQWSDITAPEVEALHAGSSGETLLIQVHRPRAQSERLFLDPALALWRIGDPAPQAFDELFMNEERNKAFVYLDVEKLAEGAPFIFDSGSTQMRIPVPVSPALPGGGGADVVQEWGVVRSSLQQRLVIPSIARLPGMFGSYWQSDVTFYNPSDLPVEASLRFVPREEQAGGAGTRTTTITLQPHEIELARDAVHSLFGLEQGAGALFITPRVGQALSATSRTYTVAGTGSYGMGIGAIDLYASSSSRFPLTFSGALLGPDYRTNVIGTDSLSRGAEVSLKLAGPLGAMGRDDFTFAVPGGGQWQLNGLASWLNVPPYERGSLVFRPVRGEAIPGVFVMDNRTNDPTYFPPDLPAPTVRTIPVIAHLDGANDSHYRSDLFLYNPTDQTRGVFLVARPWDGSTGEKSLTLTLLPNESKTVPDVLSTAFGLTGTARLRYASSGSDGRGVRATSRLYTVAPGGGTYGNLVPPFNNFQAVAAGESLEILGAVREARFRTNLALVDLSPGNLPGQPARVRVEIIDAAGSRLDSFDTNVPFAGGVQLNDLFNARALPPGEGPVLIRVTSFGNLVGAFASMLDNVTNDPTHLPAVLASQ